MVDAPDGIKKALEDFVSAARQQNLRISVLLLEDNQQTSATTAHRVELQTGQPERTIPVVAQGEAPETEKLTSTLAGQSLSSTTTRDVSQQQQQPSSGVSQFKQSHDDTSRRSSGLGKRRFAEQTQSVQSGSSNIGTTVQQDDPIVLVLSKPNADRIRQYLTSTVAPSSALASQSQGFPILSSLPRPGTDATQEASLGARPSKRLSMHRLDEGLSTKRTRVGQTEEAKVRRRPMSMPPIRTSLHSDPSGQTFPITPSLTPKFWGTVLAAGQSTNPSQQFAGRQPEVAVSASPVDTPRFPPMFQSKIHPKHNPDETGEEMNPGGGAIPGTLVGQIRSRSLSGRPEARGYAGQVTPLRSPSIKRAASSYHSGSPSFRIDRPAESSYRDMGSGSGDARRDTMGSRDMSRDVGRDVSQPGSIFDSRTPYPRSARMELSPSHSPFPVRPKSLSSLPPIGRDFSLLPAPHRGGSSASPAEEMARHAELSTSVRQQSLASLARTLTAQGGEQLPPTRVLYDTETGASGSVDARTGGMRSHGSAAILSTYGSRREGIRLPAQQSSQETTLGGSVEYISSTTRSISTLARAAGGSGQQTSFHCPQEDCEATFRRRSDMNRHIRVVHEKQRPFQCPTCSNRFGEKSNMIKHVRMVHQNIRGFRCQYCDAAFGQRGNCEAHVRAVHEKRPGKYSCEHCNRAFSRKLQLVEHCVQEHPGLPPPQARTRSRAGPSGVIATPQPQPPPPPPTPPQTGLSQQRVPVLRNPVTSSVSAQVYESAARSLLSSQTGFRQQMQMQRQQQSTQQWVPSSMQQQGRTGSTNVTEEQERMETQPGRPGGGSFGMQPK